MLKHNLSQIPSLKINQKINPTQINSIKILQMSANELEDYTRSEIEKNPFLISAKKYKETNDIIIFEQKLFYYKFNLLFDRIFWYGTKAVKKKKLINF